MAFNEAHSNEFFRIYGYRVKVGDVFPDLFLPGQASTIREFMARALRGETFHVVEEFGDPTLDRPCWDITYTPLRDARGRIVGAFHQARDISTRLRAQADLATAQDALRQSQKMEAVGQLTGGLAHDFNNLLAAIGGNLELLELRLGQGRLNEIESYLANAQGAIRRAAALTQRLLAFSRRQTLSAKPTDVNTLVADMEMLVRQMIGPGIALAIRGPADLWTTRIDGPQLENALLNLCINARDAMPDGGRITIETANVQLDRRAAEALSLAEGAYLSISVTDTGSGMTPDIVSRAFEPFFTTKPLGQGTGLGLSMVHGFVQQSGGQIEIRSVIGGGTTVCLYLPRYAGDAVAAATETAGARDGAACGETILVIDDEEGVRALMVEVLEEAGYTTMAAGDGPTGLQILQSDARVDLLITDVGLPGGMNGRQVADAARTSRTGLKVLFVTGYAETAALGDCDLDPGMEVLTKPFAMAALGSRARQIIDGGTLLRQAAD